jgi:hypothetical protein
MPNIHTPERLPNESFSAYKERRLKSKAHLDMITKPPKLPPPPIGAKINLSDWWSGQHTNPERNQQRKTLRLFKLRRVQKPLRDLHRHIKKQAKRTKMQERI